MEFGFVGLGQMGEPMAINLAQAHDVAVFGRNPEAVASVTARGARSVRELADLASVDVLLLCLPNGAVVEDILFSAKDGLAKLLKPASVVVDTSTTEFATTLSIHERLKTAGIQFLDAPVSGMRKRAEAGTLTMMIGGCAELAARLKNPLSTMASEILYMGSPGAGQLTKLINQLLFDINSAALAEVLPLASKLGLDASKVSDVVNSGTGRSYASEYFLPHILQGTFNNGYPLDAAYKDLVSGIEIGVRNKVPMPVLAAATATYQQALHEGHGDKDKGAMILVYERLSGVRFRDE